MKRSRGRNRRQSNPANRSYDSNGPDVRVRGTAMQVYEKYQTLARDMQASGDRIHAENYLQHAEHYYRIMAMHQPPRREAEDDQKTEEYVAENDAVENSVVENDISENAPAAQPAQGELPTQAGSDGTNGDKHIENAAAETPPTKARRRGPLKQREDTAKTPSPEVTV